MNILKSKKEFSKVFFTGKRLFHPLVRISVVNHIMKNDVTDTKFAFVAPKRLGNAVFRNRCKRVLREAVRLTQFPQQGMSVIFFATHKTYNAHPAQVSQALNHMLKKITEGGRNDHTHPYSLN